MRPIAVALLTGAATLSLLAGCGSSATSSDAGSAPGSPTTAAGLAPPTKEVNPAGDIPDNQIYVPYSPAGAGFAVKVPEGWSQTTKAGPTTFTDKLNSIRLETSETETVATVDSVTKDAVPGLASSVAGYMPGKVSAVTRAAGAAVRVTYQDTSAPDDVTGKTHRNAVERYEFAKGGTVAVLTLSGPVGADNVDPWKIVSDSFAWTR